LILDTLNELYRGGTKGWMMNPAEKFALEACILEAGHGDYLEIGVNRGGSLCFVGLLKRHLNQGGKLYGIEIGRAWRPEIEKLSAGLKLKTTVFYEPSNPWPAGDLSPVVALIDGCHEGSAPTDDWNNLSHRTRRFILFHDIDGADVAAAVESAKCDPDWRLSAVSGVMAIFERNG
jgi:hypothetical protein